MCTPDTGPMLRALAISRATLYQSPGFFPEFWDFACSGGIPGRIDKFWEILGFFIFPRNKNKFYQIFILISCLMDFFPIMVMRNSLDFALSYAGSCPSLTGYTGHQTYFQLFLEFVRDVYCPPHFSALV